MEVFEITSKLARETAEREHYMHRKPAVSYAFGLYDKGELVGICVFGIPASRHLQIGALPSDPDRVLELNRVWVHDRMPKNTESWFISRCLGRIPSRLVVSYADTVQGHMGVMYRALNFHYAGWTDMERRTARYDYVPLQEGAHSRESFRSGYKERVRRRPKVRYWTVTGDKRERRDLRARSGWPVLDWREEPPPTEHRQRVI